MQRQLYNAYLFRGGRLDPLQILAKRYQQFANYATPWESKYAVLAGHRWFAPVVDEEFSVIGHYGSFRGDGGGYPTDLIAPADTLNMPFSGISPTQDGKSIRVFNFSTLTDLVSNDLVFVHRKHEKPPPGYVHLSYGTTQLNLSALTAVDGQVLSVSETLTGHLVPVSYSPADLLTILKVLALLGAAAAAWAIKALSKRNSRKLLAGPTEDLAKKVPKSIPPLRKKRIVVGPLHPKVKGRPDAVDPDPKLKDIIGSPRDREIHAANSFAKRPEVKDVHLGDEARKAYNAPDGKFPDVVAKFDDVTFALGEGKGTDLAKVIQQFDAAKPKIAAAIKVPEAKVIIKEQEVVVERLTKQPVEGGILRSPGQGFGVDQHGYLLDARGFVDLSKGLPPRATTKDGKPIKVIALEFDG
jgi:hypothetical protein